MSNGSSPLVWLDDNSAVSIKSGVLVVTPEQWASHSDDVKARYRPMGSTDGKVKGRAIATEKFIFFFPDESSRPTV